MSRRPRSVKSEAHAAVSRAMKLGHLERPEAFPCRVPGCEARGDVWHHDVGYEAPYQLHVIPLCHSHHRRIHKGSIPEPRTGELRRGDRRQGNGTCWTPDALVCRLKRGGKRPTNSKVPQWWDWAEAFLAENPEPVMPKNHGFNGPAWDAWWTWRRKIPQRWSEVGLAIGLDADAVVGAA